MIQLSPSDSDDSGFLSLVQRIVNGAVAALDVRELYLVHIDNWFDHKWLGWHGRREGELRVPLFDPNRVCSEAHFIRDTNQSRWEPLEMKRALHVRQPGRSWLAQPLDRFSSSAAFIWYSGNTITNQAGSLMFYLSGAGGYKWYATFTKTESWEHDGERQITRRELETFEAVGRQLKSD